MGVEIRERVSLLHVLRLTGANPGRVELEITESIAEGVEHLLDDHRVRSNDPAVRRGVLEGWKLGTGNW